MDDMPLLIILLYCQNVDPGIPAFLRQPYTNTLNITL